MIKLKTCTVVQQLEYLDCSINELISRVQNLTNLKTYAGIVHNQDVMEDGTPKKAHVHLVLTFKETTTSQAIANALHIEEQYINKIKTTTKAAELYLVHKNDLDKFQYDAKDVFANFDFADKYDGVESRVNFSDIAKKIEDGIIKPYNLHKYVNITDYAEHKIKYDRCFAFRNQKMKGLDRDMECVFITGASQVGKTSLAKNFAARKGYSTYISSGGKNPLDDYGGQDCIILDDLRDSNFALSDFLKLCDNNTDSLVGCRFYNKSIAECRLLIVTSIKSIQEFYKGVAVIDDEPQFQLFRRFKTYIVMERDIMNMYFYNPDIRDYDYANGIQTINPIAAMYDKDVSSKLANDIMEAFKIKPTSGFIPVKNDEKNPFNS